MTAAAPTKPFFKEVVSSVAKFVQSAVVIDDEAYIVSGDAQDNHPNEELMVPNLDPIAGDDQASENNNLEEIASKSSDHIQGHTLNAKRITEAFADCGIVCGIINPEAEEDFIPRALKIASRADFIVLDYMIHKSSAKTLEFLREIALQDIFDNRQRAMIIYTAEKSVEEVFKSIEGVFESVGLKEKMERLRGEHSPIKVGSLIIDVVRKPRRDDDDLPLRGTEKKESEVPNYLIELYAELSNGILQSAVIEGLATLREQMPRLARIFDAEMDAAYLAHRSLVDIQEAPGLVISSVASVIENLLHEGQTRKKLEGPVIEKWLLEKTEPSGYLTLKLDNSKSIRVDVETTCSIIEKGLLDTPITFDGTSNSLSDKDRTKFASRLAELFIGDKVKAKRANALFAMTTSLNKRADFSYTYEQSNAPYLQLGCIIEDESNKTNERYLMCIQPVCNSVRLKGDAQFPFISLKVVEDNDPEQSPSNFHLIVPRENGKPEYLEVIYRPGSIQTLTFSPASEEKVMPTQKTASSKLEFSSVDGSGAKSWRWAAQLKPAHAQRLVQEFAVNLSRVGLDEYEWSRQNAAEKWKINKKRI